MKPRALNPPAAWAHGADDPSEAWPGRLRRLGTPLAALLCTVPLAAATLAPAPAEVDWRTSPLDLNLRGFSGERFRFRCPPGKAVPGQVVGSGPYTDGSSICAAGVHAGVIRAAGGGVVTIEMRPGQTHYAASLSHYVQSESYDQFWSGSFLVVSSDAAELPP
ncbi:MAG: LCCL domain-containing protein [Steroidobacteraceae bacterium]